MRTTLKLVVTAALAATLVAGHQATASTVDTELAGRPVTLLTGDRVTVLADGAFSVEHGPGRDGMTFQTRRVGGHLSVIPADATELLAAGRLDPRLFDVTTLLAFGYDDRRADLPLFFHCGQSGSRPGWTGTTRPPPAARSRSR